MALVVVTRLRLRDPEFQDEFFAAAVAVIEQAASSDGDLGTDVLADASNTYWTRTSWRDAAAMRQFMVAEPHLSTMTRIDDWCDEATFVSWEQDDGVLPDWDDAYQRLIEHGQVVHLRSESANNATRAFPPISQQA